LKLNPHTVLLTGLPRAGTTLSCNILNNHENVLALMEPMTPSAFDPEKGALAAVAFIREFAANTREMALHQGKVLSRQKEGVVPENPVAYEAIAGQLRQPETSLGLIDVRQRVKNAEFTLVIKHNALFSALLPDLRASFPVYGIVRNPLAVLASWNSVDLPVNNGHIPAGEMFAPELRAALAEIPDPIDRQLHILEWFCTNFVRYLPEKIIRYEDFVVNPSIVGRAMGLESAYMGSIQSRKSRNDGYDVVLMESLCRRLLNYGEAIWSFYTRDQVNELMDSIRRAA